MIGATVLFTACGGGEKAVETETIKIGGLAPLTGSLAIYGVTTTNGAILLLMK